MNSLVLETIAFVANTDYSIHGRVELIKKLLETPPKRKRNLPLRPTKKGLSNEGEADSRPKRFDIPDVPGEG